MVSDPILVGRRPLLFASVFHRPKGCMAKAMHVLLKGVSDSTLYGYRVMLPIGMHPVSFATQYRGVALFGMHEGSESFETMEDQDEILYSTPRNIYCQMALMNHSLESEKCRTFALLHQNGGDEQINEAAYVLLQTILGALRAIRAAMWDAGVIVSNRISANE